MMMAIMMMIVGSRFVGATFGLERRFDAYDSGAKRSEKLVNTRVTTQAEPLFENLDGDMAISEMPSDAGQRGKIRSAHFNQGLGLSDDFDQRAIFQHQGVVGPQPDQLGQVKFDTSSLDAKSKALFRLPQRVRQDQRINDISAMPFGRGLEADGAWHCLSVPGWRVFN
jgi:hypothetical protein